MRTGIHAATLASQRIQRAIRALKRHKRLSTRAWIREAHICAVSAVASEIRKRGIPVTCERKGRLFYYSLGAA